MAKKKTTKKTKKQAVEPRKQTHDQTQFALRLKQDLYQTLKAKAEEASVSMNQLIHGICEACMENAHVGEAVVVSGEKGVFETRQEDGCLYFGPIESSVYATPKGTMSGSQIEDEYGPEHLIAEVGSSSGIDCIGFRANIWFGLDYSGRGYRRY